MQLFDFPSEITCLRKLEKVVISKRLLLKKLVIIPKIQIPKLKVAISNVPLEADVCNILPPIGSDSNDMVMVNLKRKLMYRDRVYFEAVRSGVFKETLCYLQENNPLYQDIVIDEKQITCELLSLQGDQSNTPSEIDNLEEQENPHDCRVGANETNNENITIAPCQGKKAVVSIN